jgi:hypothetical protein
LGVVRIPPLTLSEKLTQERILTEIEKED